LIDTHCHILPGVDDGAADEAAALAMARVAVADGVRTIAVTPHMREADYPNERPRVLEVLERLRDVVRAAGLPLELRAGAEVRLAPAMVEGIRTGRLLTYDDRGRWLLLECPYRSRPVGLDEAIFELRLAGVTPVIAHPERIRYFQEDPARYEDVLRQGAIGQMTTSSLLGDFGATVARLAEEMVRRGLVHILASDAHDDEYRPPKLARARARWAELAGEESAEFATETYPRALLEGEAIDPPPPRADEGRRGLWERILGRR